MDRRRHYRVEPEDPPLEVILASPTGAGRTEAEVLNLAMGGALLRVPPLAELAVPIGGTVLVHLRDRESGREAHLQARLVHRQEEDRSRTLGLQFLDLRAAETLLTPALARQFNRRGAFRVVPSPRDPPIEVTLEAPQVAKLPLVRVPLVDLSTGGLGVDVPLEFEARMAGHDLLECLFLLPGERMPLAVNGRVRHRTLHGQGVRYGVRFADMETPAFERASEAILSYVLRRQRELGLDVESGRTHILELLRSGGGIR